MNASKCTLKGICSRNFVTLNRKLFAKPNIFPIDGEPRGKLEFLMNSS